MGSKWSDGASQSPYLRRFRKARPRRCHAADRERGRGEDLAVESGVVAAVARLLVLRAGHVEASLLAVLGDALGQVVV